ncbi:hypothetical protein, partial [Dickeya oryzae]
PTRQFTDYPWKHPAQYFSKLPTRQFTSGSAVMLVPSISKLPTRQFTVAIYRLWLDVERESRVLGRETLF